MLRPRVLLDVDGILADFITPCLAVLHELTGHTFTPSQVIEWRIMTALGVSDDVAKQAFAQMKQSGYCRAIPVYPGSQQAVAMLTEIADVYAVTSPMDGPHWAHERELWLEEHFGIVAKRVVSTSAKYLCAGDVLLDDKTETLVKWRQHHPQGLPIRWDMPYNANDEWDGLHIHNWDTLFGVVLGVAAMNGKT